MKSTKWGFKGFFYCVKAKTGYCITHKFFSGKGKAEFKIKNLCMDMTKGFENQDYHIYMDNYYTTVNIMNLLYDKQIYSTGTIKKNSKKLPNKEAILNTESNAL